MSNKTNDALLDSIVGRLEALPATFMEKMEIERYLAENDLEEALYALNILEAKYAEDLR